MEEVYKIIEEWARPKYIDVETSTVLYEEDEESWQAYWLVSWDTEEQEVTKWIEKFAWLDQAKKYAEEHGMELE